MKKNDLEDMFKKSFENFEPEVNPSVWKNIQTGLKGAGLGVLAKMLLNKIGTNAIVAVVSSAAAVVGTVLVMNYNGNKTETTKNNHTTPVKIIAPNHTPIVANEIKNFLASSENPKPVVKEAPESNVLKTENKNTLTNNTDKKQIQNTIKELSGDRVAAISSSCVGGAIPLIINLTNNGTGKINKWSFNDGTKAITGANPIKVFDVPGLYTITLTSIGADGKSAVDSVRIEVTGNSSLPSLQPEFSPNADGLNDVFVFSSKYVVNYTATVFDEKGKIYYNYTGVDGKWDGTTLKGSKAKEGIYYFIVNAVGTDGKRYDKKGKIKLTR